VSQCCDLHRVTVENTFENVLPRVLLSCWALAEGSSFAAVVEFFCCCSRSLLACGCTGCGIICAAAAAAPSPDAPALVCDMCQHDLIYMHICTYTYIHVRMCMYI
jgi:hypothetical protein